MAATRERRASLHAALTSLIDVADPTIAEVLQYVNVPRKYLCAMVVAGAYRAAGGKEAQAETDVVVFSEAVNLSWMLIDDIVDEHNIRFAKRAARIAFGTPRSLLAAMYLLSNGYARLGQYNCPSIVDLGRTYQGWLKRDVISGKPLIECKRTLEDLGSCYATFMRIAAEVAEAPRTIRDCIHHIGLQFGYCVTLLSEFFDLNGSVVGRPIAEELKHGNDVFLVRAAEEEGIILTSPDEAWPLLRKTSSFSRMRTEIADRLTSCELQLRNLPGPVDLILASVGLVREQRAGFTNLDRTISGVSA